MSEFNPQQEQEPVQADFGDVVIAPNHNYGLPSVVITANREGTVNAMAIIDEAEHEYGMPGTLPAGSIEAIIGRKSYDEVVEICSFLFTDGEQPTESTIARVKQLLAKELTDD